MRIAGLILAILGAAAAAFLGFTWLSDYNASKELIDLAGSSELSSELSSYGTASYMLIVGALVGLAGGVLTFMGRGGKWAGPLMIVAALAPAIFAPKALVFTGILLLAGILCTVVGLKKVNHQPVSMGNPTM